LTTRQRRHDVSAPVPESVPGRDPTPVQQHPTATKLVRKNRPEIRKFRPVLRARVTLANRRLQPLGHLTVWIFLTISAIRRWPIRLCSSLCSSLPNLRPSVHLDGGFADHRLVNDEHTRAPACGDRIYADEDYVEFSQLHPPDPDSYIVWRLIAYQQPQAAD
jgi:hypothetical protein